MRFFYSLILLTFCLGDSHAQLNYNKTENWYQIPNEQADTVHKPADVFFIHPTTFYLGNKSNAERRTPSLDQRTEWTMVNQASVFKGSCRVFSPFYRQASLQLFKTRDDRLNDALDLAYTDVHAAFKLYMEKWNDGRPIVLASHSQGSLHMIRLLQDFFNGKNEDKLVVAYVLGIPLYEKQLTSTLSKMSYCQSSTQTGCLISWQTKDLKYIERKDRELFWLEDLENEHAVQLGKKLLTNPLVWRSDTLEYGASFHKGALKPIYGRNDRSSIPNHLNARIREGFLYIDGHDRTLFNAPAGNLHRYDYNLFYEDIKVNVEERITSFLKQN